MDAVAVALGGGDAGAGAAHAVARVHARGRPGAGVAPVFAVLGPVDRRVVCVSSLQVVCQVRVYSLAAGHGWQTGRCRERKQEQKTGPAEGKRRWSMCFSS